MHFHLTQSTRTTTTFYSTLSFPHILLTTHDVNLTLGSLSYTEAELCTKKNDILICTLQYIALVLTDIKDLISFIRTTLYDQL